MQDCVQFDIAVIGAGFSGTLTTIHLLRSRARKLRLLLIEREEAFGLGLAYRTDCAQHLLNVRAKNMSAYPEEPLHFCDWLKSRTYPYSADDFVPRMLYGRYLQDCFQKEVQSSAAFHSLQCIHDTVLSIAPNDTHTGAKSFMELALKSTQSFFASQVVLAIGNLAPAIPKQVKHLPFLSGQFLNAPCPAGQLTGDEFLLIGTGLTAVDTLLSIFEKNPRARVTAISRRGLLPISHKLTPPSSKPFSLIGLSLREAMKLFRAHVQETTTAGSDWRSEVDALRPEIQGFWNGLQLKEKKMFLRHVRPFWDVHRHRIAESIAEKIAAFVSSGQLQFLGGHIQSISMEEESIALVLRKRHSGEQIVISVQQIINCTGPSFDTTKPPLASLLETSLAVLDDLHFGLKTDPTGRLLSGEGLAPLPLYTLGPLRKGELWESIAVPELRMQAKLLAEQLQSQEKTDSI